MDVESSTEANREATTETSTETPEASFTPQETTSRPRRLKDLEVGMELDGRVTSVALYGIFVDIGLGRDGLVHISEMSDKRIDSPSDMVNIGDGVKVFVKKVDLEDRRISLTMRQPREEPEKAPRGRFRRNEPDRDALAQLQVGDVVNGTITGLAPFGAFVDIGVGKDGLVHISELAENRVHKPEEAVQVGSQRTFKVLEVDPEGNRISLSLRRAQRIERMQQLSPGDIVEGKVSGLAPFGAFVDIGVGRDGLVHISQLSHDRVGKVEDVVKIGDPITARVLEVDTQGKRISLTLRLEEPEPEPIPEEPETAVREEKTVSSAAMEAAYPPPRRDNRREGKGKRGRGNRGNTSSPPVLETYVAGDDTEEEFEGNATLEDLLTKFGGTNSRKDRRRRNDDEEIDEEDRFISRKKQREAIQRTLQRRDDDE
jgi:ribosomal protein S1